MRTFHPSIPARRRGSGAVLAATLMLLAAAVLAAPPAPSVTDQQMEDAKRLLTMPTDADVDAVHRSLAPLQTHPGVVPPAARVPRTPVDPAALSARTQQFADALQSQVLGSRTEPGLYVFVSFSMPLEALQGLAEQAERAQATFVIRGFKNRSLRSTVEAAHGVIGDRKVSWVIDPTAFDRFDIKVVPTVVLTTAAVSGGTCSSRECTPPDAFGKVAGEVPIEHAVREIARRVPSLAAASTPYLRRLGSSWR